MQYLIFELSDDDQGNVTLEAMASTSAGEHAGVLAEVQQVLAWARGAFARGPGPLDDGMDWDHDLQVHTEPGNWHAVTLTLTGTRQFAEAFLAAFGDVQT
ncbi:hypothetical protein [Ideonella sp. BN130291]|uniref:hypothetical protein n=1 Tax=Ideonella sp. BN130291 TaxID=3112940 RepID=UPI002E252376|nr:hypothetical protein [Ideonella sp. BN130291]